MTFRVGVLLALAAGLLVTAASAAPPRYVYKDVAFVTLQGQGTVRSLPRGVDCPRSCRATFLRGTHVRLLARAAPGWKLASFTSRWCTAKSGVCGIDLVSPHDCVGGACPLGAYGVQVRFVRR